MKVNRKDLLKSLEQVSQGLSDNTIVPLYGYFRFLGNKVQATDGIMVLESILPIDTEMYCYVPGKLFFNLLKGLDVKTVNLTIKENKLTIKTNRSVGTFTVIQEAEPVKLALSGTKLPIDKDFLEGLRICRKGVSPEESSGLFGGVVLDKNILYSTDRYKIYKYKLSSNFGSIICSLPTKFIDIILKYKNDIVEYDYYKTEESSSFTVFFTDGFIVSTLTIQDKYRDLEEFFPIDFSKSLKITLSSDFKNSISRFVDFQKTLNKAVKELVITLENKECIFYSRVEERQELIETLDLPSSVNQRIEFIINPVYFQELSNFDSTFYYFEERGLILIEVAQFSCMLMSRK